MSSKVLAKFLGALVMFISSPGTPPPMAVDRHSLFTALLEIISVDKSPGAVFAVRLKNLNPEVVRLCFRQQCIALAHQWALLPTNPDTASPQQFLFEDASSRWAVVKLDMDASMFEKIRMRIANLRLPTAVAKFIRSNDEAIEIEKIINKQIFTRQSEKTWGKQWVKPIASKITSTFGSLRIAENGGSYAHKGVDLRARNGTPVYASADGWVVALLEQVVSGKVVTIDHGRGVMSRYLHLSEFKVGIAQELKAGELIALSGTSGRSEAPHLHWEIRVRGYPVDPLSTARLMERLSYLE